MIDSEKVFSPHCSEHASHGDKIADLEADMKEFIRDSRSDFKEIRKAQVEMKVQLAKWSGVVIGIASIPTIIKIAEILVPAARAAVEVSP